MALINVDLISNYITSNKLSNKEFSKLCDVDIEILNKILNGEDDIDISIVFKIAKMLNLNIIDILSK